MQPAIMPKIETPKSVIPEKLQGLHLFHYNGAPCAQRVRFALGEKGLSRGREEKFAAISPSSVLGETGKWISRHVSLPMKDHMTTAYSEIHPNMVVPALAHEGVLYLESMDIIEYLDDAFGGNRLVPAEEKLREASMRRVQQAKDLHRSIRFVTFHWGLGRLAMLNPKERAQLATLASEGKDEEQLVSFYDQYSTGTIPDSVYFEHLRGLYSAFAEINTELEDGRQFLMSDDLTIADPFWSMKILRLLECGYPVKEYHPSVYAWFERIYKRPSFQNEVMGRNRLANRVFRVKASIEGLFGKGLRQAVERVAV
jgi:glutathione S-transferase